MCAEWFFINHPDYDEIRKHANDVIKNSVAVAPTPELVADTVLNIIKT